MSKSIFSINDSDTIEPLSLTNARVLHDPLPITVWSRHPQWSRDNNNAVRLLGTIAHKTLKSLPIVPVEPHANLRMEREGKGVSGG